MKSIAIYTSPETRKTARTYWNAETEEFIVKLIGAPKADYFTNDKDDALGTMKVMADFVPRLGTTKDGFEIIARGCNEDNSGVACARSDGKFEVRCAYPIDATYNPDTGQETLVYNAVYETEHEATEALRKFIGSYSGW